METKRCELCGRDLEVGKFSFSGDGVHRRKTCGSCAGRRWRAKVTLEAFKLFGGKCQCCGESHPSFLTLDHIHGCKRGYRQGRNKEQLYREAIKAGPSSGEFQLLCMNCNFAKGHFGECPHKIGITPEMAWMSLEETSKGLLDRYSLSGNQRTGGYKVVPKQLGWQVRQVIDQLRASGITLEELSQCLPKPVVG